MSVKSWSEFCKYIHSRYPNVVDAPDGEAMRFRLGIDNGRSQMLFLRKVTRPDGTDWAEILSPIGSLSESQSRAALEHMETSPIGGLVRWPGNDLVLLRHMLSLKTFDHKDFTWIAEYLLVTADTLEQSMLGIDNM